MLTEVHKLIADKPVTNILWKGLPVLRIRQHKDGGVYIFRATPDGADWPTGAKLTDPETMREALLQWFLTHDIERVELVEIEGNAYLVRDERRVPMAANPGEAVATDLLRIDAEEWDKASGVWRGGDEPAPRAEAIPDDIVIPKRAPAPAAPPVDRGPSPSHTRRMFPIPKVEGERYPVFACTIDQRPDGVAIRYKDVSILTMSPKRVSIEGDTRPDVATRIRHLAIAFDLGFDVERRNGIFCLSPREGYVASTADGDVAGEGDWLVLAGGMTVEAC